MLRFALIAALFVMALALPTAASAQVVPGEEHCVVNIKTNDALNVRAKPSASSRIITALDYAECGVIVDTCLGNWCLIDADDAAARAPVAQDAGEPVLLLLDPLRGVEAGPVDRAQLPEQARPHGPGELREVVDRQALGLAGHVLDASAGPVLRG